MQLTDSLIVLKGVGDEVAKKFASVGVRTVGDLIYYYPRGYEDYSDVQKIRGLKTGRVTVRGVIKQAKGRYIRGGLHITEAILSDDTDSVRLTWFNQPYRADSLKKDTEYFVSGDFGLKARRMSITNPTVELVSDFPVNTARIVPKYRQTKILTSQMIRRSLREAFKALSIPELFPPSIIKSNKLMPLKKAIHEIHFPSSSEALQQARWRLGFNEVFELIMASMLNKTEVASESTVKIPFDETLAKAFVASLPFKLTDDQKRVAWQIYQDIDSTKPMNRLVEGDVGSGKTVVALMAAIMTIQAGYQVAFMAPTEILARQHADTLHSLLKTFKLEHVVSLHVGSMKSAQKKLAQKAAQSGAAQLLVGTHALIQEKIDMQKLGLVIIDEQHRFGTEQRKALIAKAGHMPHVLSMTATPIPRSLALTLYGELDISVISTKPKNRRPITTKIIKANDRQKLYDSITSELKTGRQMFVVSPLIESSTAIHARSTEEVLKDMKKAFPNFKIGLLHGRLKSEDKQRVMQDFVGRKLDILVSTTVIEVGVDVPNASIMLIESPERFGLSQIHQLRGRVGRGEHQAYCYLLLTDNNPPTKRIKAVESTSDGFKLAELDLELRGPGSLFGSLQHGALDMQIAKITDTHLIASARQAAKAYIQSGNDLLQYKELYERVSSLRAVVHLN